MCLNYRKIPQSHIPANLPDAWSTEVSNCPLLTVLAFWSLAGINKLHAKPIYVEKKKADTTLVFTQYTVWHTFYDIHYKLCTAYYILTTVYYTLHSVHKKNGNAF